MGEVINLRMARKARSRRAAQHTAQANRVRHGRTKAEIAAETGEAEKLQRLLDGAERESD